MDFEPPEKLLSQGTIEGNIELENANTRVKCGNPGCIKDFAVDGLCRLKHRQMCRFIDVTVEPERVESPSFDNNNEENVGDCVERNLIEPEEDAKYNYTCSLLRDGLKDWVREDAAKENDGDRLIRMWKYDLLDFSLNNHTKYKILAFRLHSQLLALLPPSLSAQLRHNRCVNMHGGEGCNIPGDLALEIHNMVAKDALKHLSGNLTAKSIERTGKSLRYCETVTENYRNDLPCVFW